MTLFQFLRASRRAWQALGSHSSWPSVNIVIGNEAGDADSMISAIMYAYFRQASAALPAGATDTMHVPFISCRRSDFNLRREASHLLELARESESDPAAALALDGELLFLDDLDMDTVNALARQAKLQISLVDHNKLSGQLATNGVLDECVCDIIDHHRDMRAHLYVSGDKRIISFDEVSGRGVGSTCTLVAQMLLQWKRTSAPIPPAGTSAAAAESPWKEGRVDSASSVSFSSVGLPSEEPEADRPAFDSSPAAVLNEVSAALLAGVILLDTINLDPAAGKTTQLDIETVRQLAALVEFRTRKTFDGGSVMFKIVNRYLVTTPQRNCSWRCRALYYTLNALRDDPFWWKSLTPSQALGYDYKTFEATLADGNTARYGISAIGMHVCEFLAESSPAKAREDDDIDGDEESPATAFPILNSMLACMSSFAQERSLHFYALMSRCNKQRQIALLYSPSWGEQQLPPALYASLLQSLQRNEVLQLNEVTVTGLPASSDMRLLVARQGNSTASRKQVVPVIEDIIKTLVI